jgi:serine/threonine protein kinase
MASMARGRDLAPSIGGYTVLRLLGEGGMGRVFLARHEVLEREVVIKQIRPHLAVRPDLVHRFVAEARAAARLRHPNVVEVLDCALAPDGAPYLVLEYLRGQTLHAWLSTTGAADPRLVALIVAQVASALVGAHAAGIVHRDLKPENLFLTDAPLHLAARLRLAGLPTALFVKVLDFGIAKLADSVGPRPGFALGTPAFMPPEQLEDSADVDGRADVYALGAVAWEALTGRPLPWAGRSLVEIHRAQLEGPPPDPRALRPALSPDLAAVVARALAGDRNERWPTIDAFARAFAAAVPDGATILTEVAPALVDEPPSAAGPAPPAARPRPALSASPASLASPASPASPVGPITEPLAPASRPPSPRAARSTSAARRPPRRRLRPRRSVGVVVLVVLVALVALGLAAAVLALGAASCGAAAARPALPAPRP